MKTNFTCYDCFRSRPHYRAIVCFLIFLFSSLISYSQAPYSAGGEQAALGGNSLLPANVWSVQNCPAAMAGLKGFQAGLWAERRYNLSDFTNGACAVAIPTGKVGVIGIGIYQYGGSAYLKQQKYSLCYALPITSSLYVGVGLHALNTHIELYGNELAVLGEFSLLYKISYRVQLAASAWNVGAVRLAAYQNERLPLVFRLGSLFTAAENVKLFAEVEKQVYGQLNAVSLSPALSLKLGLLYRPAKDIDLQAGLRSNPGQDINAFVYSFGIGLQYQKVRLLLAFAIYDIVGSTPNVSFEYMDKMQGRE
jgi:hypothetical protein